VGFVPWPRVASPLVTLQLRSGGLRSIATTALALVVACALVGVAARPASAAEPTGQLAIARNVTYSSADGTPLLLDVYAPAAAKGLPAVILVHGGGFVGGSKEDLAPEATALAKAGFVVFDVDYTLNSTAVYPRQVAQVRAALAWAGTNGPTYGADPRRIGLVGSSAGAYLAAMAGVGATGGPGPKVRAVVTLSGPFDLETYPGLAAAGPSPVNPSLTKLLGCPATGCDAGILRAASPVSYVGKATPPFLIANGTDELIPFSQAQDMEARLRASGVPVDLQAVPGSRHAVAYVADVATPILAFLRVHLAPVHTGGSGFWTVWWFWSLLCVGAVLVAMFGVYRRAGRTRTPYI
jgi:acetyl esterase/lipase